MAITSLAARTFLNPANPLVQVAGNPLVVIMTSNQTGQPNYRFVLRVQNTANTFNFGFFKSDPVPTFSVFAYPDIAVNNGFVHIQTALQAAFESGFYCLIDSAITPLLIFTYPQGLTRVTLVANDEYGNPPAIIAGGSMSLTISVINGGWEQTKYDTIDPTRYIQTTTPNVVRLLANECLFRDPAVFNQYFSRHVQPKSYPWSLRYYQFFTAPALGQWRWRMWWYDKIGNIVRNIFGPTINEGSLAQGRLVTIPVGMGQFYGVSTIMSDGFALSVQTDNLTGNGGAIQIHIEDPNTGAVIIPPAYYPIDPCPVRYNAIELHWINEQGATDSFTFVGKNRKSAILSRTYFSKYQNGLMTKAEKEVNNAFQTFEWELNTDWLEDTEFQFLFGAFKSRKAWIVDYGTNPQRGLTQPWNPIAVNIEVNSYRFFERVTDKLKSLSVKVTGAIKNKIR